MNDTDRASKIAKIDRMLAAKKTTREAAEAAEKAAAAPAMEPVRNPVQTLVGFGKDCYTFPGEDGSAYAHVQIDRLYGSHWELHRVNGPGFRRYLRGRYFDATREQQAARKEHLDEAIAIIATTAERNGPRQPVSLRVASSGGLPPPSSGSAIYIDLGNESWDVAQVTAEGWQILRNTAEAPDDEPPPGNLYRAGNMGALPEPQRGGSLDLLRQYVSVTDADWPLIVGWLLQSLKPGSVYPPLALVGEAGSGKSTAAKVLRCLVDPHTPLSRGVPHEGRDLRATVVSNWVVSLDNLSSIPPWLSDDLCRIATERRLRNPRPVHHG